MSVYDYSSVKEEFERRGYTLLTDHKVSSKDKYAYVCNKHQEYGVQYIDWGHFHCSYQGCRICANKKSGDARRKILTDEEYSKLAESKGFEYVGVRRDTKIMIQFICPKHRQYGVQEMSSTNMKRVVCGCQHCIGRGDSNDDIIQMAHDANDNVEVLEIVDGHKNKLKCRCVVHNVIYTTSLCELRNGKGCVQCGYEKLSMNNRVDKHTFADELNVKFPYIAVQDDYTMKTQRASFYCSRCDKEFVDYPMYVQTDGCPYCDSMKGRSVMEEMIADYLSECHIEYIREFSFADCKDQRVLPFDFYVPSHNLLIEYDGRQHYRPIKRSSSMTDEDAERVFATIVKHDIIKTSYCKTHGIHLLRIGYWQDNQYAQLIEQYIDTL